MLKRVAEDTPRPIREIIPEMPQWLCDIIAKLHAKNPDDRFQSAREVADVLADCEAQLKQNSRLRDFSRIPREKSAPRRSLRRTWAAAAGVLLLVFAAFWFGRTALLYLSNRGELRLLPEEGLVSVIVLENDEGDLVTDKLHTPMTDWLDMAGKSQSVKLPPGRYQLNVSTSPMGTQVSQWSISNSGPFGSDQVTVPVINSSAIVTVERGHRVTLRAVVSRPAVDPTLVSVVPQSADGWVQLFNGKDLTGWKFHPDHSGHWEVKDGILRGSKRHSHLFSQRGDYENFHLRAEVKINLGGDSGILFRAPLELVRGRSPFEFGIPGCYEAELQHNRTHLRPTGSILVTSGDAAPTTLGRVLDTSLTEPDEWFTYEVIAEGNHFLTKINGSEAANCSDLEDRHQAGHLALQVWHANTLVQFRKIEIKELPASPPVSEGFVSLFNGKDLTGWKTHPERPGQWKVEHGALVGSTVPSYLFSDGTYGNFHLRLEAKINQGGDSSVFLRTPFSMRPGRLADQAQPAAGYDVELQQNPTHPFKTGSVADAETAGSPKLLWWNKQATLTSADEWFTLEIIADGNRIITKVNGTQTADCRDPRSRYDAGHLALQVCGPQTIVQFRKIEIKELPPSSPDLPKRTADVLAFIQGTWKREAVVVEPKLPNGGGFGHLTFDAVAGGKVMRGLTVDEHGRPLSLILHSYDSTTDRIHSWYFSDDGETNSSSAGVYDPANRSFLWMERLPDGTQSVHHLDFVDVNTVRSKNYDMDAASNIIHESHATFTRTSQPPAVPKSAIDPQRPAEMKVLDRLVGEWRDEITVTIPGTPAQPKKEVQRTQARSILGGRMIETMTTNETTNSNDYSVLWYDVAAKRYRLWAFLGDGQAFELSGTWNETTQTNAFASSDGVRFGHTIFKSDDQHEFRRAPRTRPARSSLTPPAWRGASSLRVRRVRCRPRSRTASAWSS